MHYTDTYFKWKVIEWYIGLGILGVLILAIVGLFLWSYFTSGKK